MASRSAVTDPFFTVSRYNHRKFLTTRDCSRQCVVTARDHDVTTRNVLIAGRPVTRTPLGLEVGSRPVLGNVMTRDRNKLYIYIYISGTYTHTHTHTHTQDNRALRQLLPPPAGSDLFIDGFNYSRADR